MSKANAMILSHREGFEMISIKKNVRIVLSASVLAGALLIQPSVFSQNKKLTVDELVSRHLASIGTPEARAAVTSRGANGTIQMVSRVGRTANLEGKGVLVSTGSKMRYSLKFTSQGYPGEQLAFDGNKSSTGISPTGQRTSLCALLNRDDMPLKEGLIGGVLSTAWPLLRISQQQPKLDYRGMNKVEGRQLHEVSYRAKKGSGEMRISLYFDPETFRHVRTKYQLEGAPEMGSGLNNQSTRGSRDSGELGGDSRYEVIETFDDFKAVDGLTLPYKYKLQLSIQTATQTIIYDWTLTVDELSHKETFPDQVFKIGGGM